MQMSQAVHDKVYNIKMQFYEIMSCTCLFYKIFAQFVFLLPLLAPYLFPFCFLLFKNWNSISQSHTIYLNVCDQWNIRMWNGTQQLLNSVSQWKSPDQHTHTHTAPVMAQMRWLTQTQERDERVWITWGHRYVMMMVMVMKAGLLIVLWFSPQSQYNGSGTERPWITAMKTLRLNKERACRENRAALIKTQASQQSLLSSSREQTPSQSDKK